MPNKYISIINNGSNALYIKDAEARLQIEDIKNGLTGGLHYIGRSSTKLEEDIEGPWIIDGITYDCYYFYVVPSGQSGATYYIRTPIFDDLTVSGGTETKYYAFALSKNLSSSDVPNILYVLNDTVIHTGTTLYKKQNGEFVEAGGASGINIDSLNQVHYITSGATELVTGAVAFYVDNSSSTPKELEYVFGITGWSEFGSTGSLKALAFKDNATGSVTAVGSNAPSLVTFESGSGSNFVTGFDTNPVAPSFTEGAFNAGSLPSFTEGTFTQGTLPSLGEATTGTFATEGITMTYVEGTETLVFGTANTSSAVTAQGTFNAGTLPTKAADSFNAGSLPSKSTDTFSAGTVPTLATAKALTASDTGTAAAQTFTGSAVSVTVS